MKSTWQSLPGYTYRGARAMILLQDKYLREFLVTWRKGKALGILVPQTEDPNYESWESILFHVLRASRGYLTWIAEKLELPEPQVGTPPELETINNHADEFLDHLLHVWSKTFVAVPEEKFDSVFKSRWDIDYCLDGMLEHAVMHPIRHAFQIEEWIQEKLASK